MEDKNNVVRDKSFVYNKLFFIVPQLIVLLSLGWLLTLYKQEQNVIKETDIKSQTGTDISCEASSSSGLDYSVAYLLLKSNKLDAITVGVASYFLPTSSLKYDKSYPRDYTFNLYGLELPEKDHETLLRYLDASTQYYIFDYLWLNEGPDWQRSQTIDTRIELSREGFYCITPPHYGVYMCPPGDPDATCITMGFEGLRCAYVENPAENNAEKVIPFIEKVLCEADISCGKRYDIKLQEPDTIILKDFQRRITHSGEKCSVADSLKASIDQAKNDVTKSRNLFTAAEWTVSEKDLTSEETGKKSYVTYLLKEITASNDLYSCVHKLHVKSVPNEGEITGRSYFTYNHDITCEYREDAMVRMSDGLIR